ncbi:class I SAM-dependent methyltransferase [Candidatus Parcubacteria bacterium]|jgi:2-polyprenyl-3-methyl-5-hydroxy-6-metoxy-1,4-benzoquinol methylase|nr:class I SAM-dependent methyltransferase [Candidatus Parcubacteria bacterium]
MSLGFSKKLIDSLVCQQDGAPLVVLEIQQENEFVIFSAKLKCQQCDKIYNIQQGILNCLLEQGKMKQLMQDEVEARDKEAEQYDQRLSVRYHKEIPSTMKTIGNLSGRKVLEYGCGTGRLTTVIAPECRAVLATDFSLISLQILAKKLDNYKNVGLVLSNAVQFKAKSKYFDLATSFQFLEHVPSKEQRLTWLGLVKKTLKSSGEFVSTVYHYDWRKQKDNQNREGKHGSGIFFHYFTQEELANEVTGYFQVQDLHPIDITLPLEAKLKLPAKIAGQLSRVFEKISIANKFGHLLIVKAIKNK